MASSLTLLILLSAFLVKAGPNEIVLLVEESNVRERISRYGCLTGSGQCPEQSEDLPLAEADHQTLIPAHPQLTSALIARKIREEGRSARQTSRHDHRTESGREDGRNFEKF